MSSYFYVLIPGMIQYKVRRHSFSTFVSSSAVAAGLFSRSRPRSTQGGCTHAMHDRSRMTIPAMSGWSTSGVHRPGTHCLHQARSVAGGARVHYDQIWAPAGLRGARSGCSISREPALCPGITFRPAEPSRPMETPKSNLTFFMSLFFALLLFPNHHSRPQRLGSHGTTVAAVQAFPFVTATHGASACVCVRVRHPRIQQ